MGGVFGGKYVLVSSRWRCGVVLVSAGVALCVFVGSKFFHSYAVVKSVRHGAAERYTEQGMAVGRRVRCFWLGLA